MLTPLNHTIRQILIFFHILRGTKWSMEILNDLPQITANTWQSQAVWSIYSYLKSNTQTQGPVMNLKKTVHWAVYFSASYAFLATNNFPVL
jgi:hypothetical protein